MVKVSKKSRATAAIKILRQRYGTYRKAKADGLTNAVLLSAIGEGRGETAAIILGTMVGAAIGGSIGRSMDETDRMRTNMALENVRTGVSTTWRNPDTNTQYAVTPTRTYESSAGPCREFSVQALVDGRQDEVVGTACRQLDGSWRMR